MGDILDRKHREHNEFRGSPRSDPEENAGTTDQKPDKAEPGMDPTADAARSLEHVELKAGTPVMISSADLLLDGKRGKIDSFLQETQVTALRNRQAFSCCCCCCCCCACCMRLRAAPF